MTTKQGLDVYRCSDYALVQHLDCGRYSFGSLQPQGNCFSQWAAMHSCWTLRYSVELPEKLERHATVDWTRDRWYTLSPSTQVLQLQISTGNILQRIKLDIVANGLLMDIPHSRV